MKPWHRSRLLWLGLSGFVFVLWAWLSPFLSGKGTYFSVRWIAPGDFYQGFGIKLDFHRFEFWCGRPYLGLFGVPRSGINYGSYPFEARRHSWAVNDRGPIWHEWGTPSSGRITIAVDYWFLAPAYLITLTAAVILWQRRKRGIGISRG